MEEEPLSSFHFPPGFRFHPSDEELIVHYLLKKVNSQRLPASVIAEIELYNFNPWELPRKALFGEDEWYFFSPRDRKYPNGKRPNRTAASGFWKATGTDRPIRSSMLSRIIGVKKALVFYTGRPPNGSKTEWIMNEYRLPETRSRSSKLKGSMRLDDWILCRVRKKGNMSKNAWEVKDTPSKSAVYLPKMQELPSSYTKANTNVITDRLFKEFQVMASILAGQDLPPVEAISSGAFQGGKQSNNNSLVYNIDPGNVNTTDSWFDSCLNPSKNKVHEGHRFNSVVRSTMMIAEVKESEDLLPENMLTSNDTNYFGNYSEGDIYNLNHSGTVINLAELNGSSFLGRSIQ